MSEDPGAGVINVILEFLRRSIDAFFDTIKTAVSTLADITRVRSYRSYRKEGRDRNGALHHGKQSLKHLRRHEELGDTLKTVDVGNWRDMWALRRELNKAKVDYSFSHSRGHGYSLHYKERNEGDVLRAQKHAIDRRYGSHFQTQTFLYVIQHVTVVTTAMEQAGLFQMRIGRVRPKIYLQPTV